MAHLANAARRRILVVEDDLDTCETFAWLLRHMGHEVAFAINGWAALGVARDFRPDVVILDLGLPDTDGCVLAPQLRLVAGLDRLRIVVVSGRGWEDDHERSLSAGCDQYFVKPMDPALLESALAA